ncbi:MAG: UDP-2,3-diacylglucosamine diphosphatase LpxI [Micropepsaceae bacterium]
MALGLILGAGKYATHLHEQLRHTNRAKASIAISPEVINGETHGTQIDRFIDGTFGIGQIDDAIATLVARGVSRVIFGGDFRALESVAGETGPVGPSIAELIRRVSSKLNQHRIKPVHATKELPDLAVRKGIIGGPSACGPALRGKNLEAHAYELARIAQTASLNGISLLAIRQSMLFDHTKIVPVEGARGTDDLLERALSHKKQPGVVRALVKLTAKDIDPRLDPPVVGLRTIEGAKAAEVSLIVLDAGRGIICEKEEVMEACRKHHVTLFGVHCE